MTKKKLVALIAGIVCVCYLLTLVLTFFSFQRQLRYSEQGARYLLSDAHARSVHAVMEQEDNQQEWLQWDLVLIHPDYPAVYALFDAEGNPIQRSGCLLCSFDRSSNSMAYLGDVGPGLTEDARRQIAAFRDSCPENRMIVSEIMFSGEPGAYKPVSFTLRCVYEESRTLTVSLADLPVTDTVQYGDRQLSLNLNLFDIVASEHYKKLYRRLEQQMDDFIDNTRSVNWNYLSYYQWKSPEEAYFGVYMPEFYREYKNLPSLIWDFLFGWHPRWKAVSFPMGPADDAYGTLVFVMMENQVDSVLRETAFGKTAGILFAVYVLLGGVTGIAALSLLRKNERLEAARRRTS